MRRIVLMAVLLVPLSAASPAAAKEVLSVTVCGTNDCSTSREGGFMRAMTDVGPPTDAPQRPARFYRLVVAVGEGDEVAGRDELSWVPSAGVLLTVDGTWIAARPEIRSGLDGLTRGLVALPAARLAGFPAAASEPAAPPPRESPASSSPASSDLPIVLVLAAAVALVIAGLLVRGHRRSAPSASATP
jgi:hypothetical protein